MTEESLNHLPERPLSRHIRGRDSGRVRPARRHPVPGQLPARGSRRDPVMREWRFAMM